MTVMYHLVLQFFFNISPFFKNSIKRKKLFILSEITFISFRLGFTKKPEAQLSIHLLIINQFFSFFKGRKKSTKWKEWIRLTE